MNGRLRTAALVGYAVAVEIERGLIGDVTRIRRKVGVAVQGYALDDLDIVGHTVRIAIGIAGSQKTLMVGLQIAIDCGVSVIPMLVYQLCQLVIDTVVAERWKRRSRELERGSGESEDK